MTADPVRDRWHATLVCGHSLLDHEIGGIRMALLLIKSATDAARRTAAPYSPHMGRP
jgi:hypothetical protein